MRVVVTGALGQFGAELCRQIGPEAIPLSIRTLDLTDDQAVLQTFMGLRPETIINCAAYTQVDKVESDPDRAHAVNVTAVEHLVRVCRELDCPLVQISTDYVFGGNEERVQGSWFRIQNDKAATDLRPPTSDLMLQEHRSYKEDDPPAPQSVYARTKFAGEQAAAKLEKHLIVRTCGLYSHPSDARAQNFVKTMLRLGAAQRAIRVVNDQWCTPSYVPHVARAVLFLAGIAQPKTAPWGIYHVTNTGATTWYDFAVEIFKQAGMDVNLTAISTAEYEALAPRPAYSVLDTTAYHRLGGPPLPDWKTALEEYFEEWRKLQHEN